MLLSVDAPPAWRAIERQARSLGQQADRATAFGATLDLDWLAGAARSLSVAAPDWQHAFDGETPTERSYRLLAETDALEMWMIWWPRGGRLDYHDHGGSLGAFAVVSGVLTETYFDIAGPARRRVIGPQQCVAFGRDHIHDVVNLHRAGATSVHVYSPPTSAMTFYRLGDDGRPRAVRRAPHPDPA